MRARGLAAAASAALLAAAPAQATPLRTRVVPLPASVHGVQFPFFSADGDRLVAVGRSPAWRGVQVVSFTQSGTGVRCLSCGAWTGAPLQKPIPFPDGRRILVRIGVQAPARPVTHGVLECTPSVARCVTARLVPITAPAAGDRGVAQAERELRIAPDGRHIALTQVRLSRTGRARGVGIVGRLERGEATYAVRDARVVATDGELKGWTPDGRGILFARYGGVEAANPDVVRVDLGTGRERRLTAFPDWDEDVALHGGRLLVGSARGAGLLEAAAALRRPAAIGPALSTLPFTAFSREQPRIAEPWLVGVRAERAGRRGRALAPGAVRRGWDSRANTSWSPGGTAATFWQRRIDDPDRTRVLVTDAGGRPHRAAVRRLHVGAWAPRLAGFAPPDPAPARSRRGRVAGRMIVHDGPAPAGSGYERSVVVRYQGFADRRGAVLDGWERGRYDVAGTFGARSRYSADVRLHGRHRGRLRAHDVVLERGRLDGVIRTRLDGRRLSLGSLSR